MPDVLKALGIATLLLSAFIDSNTLLAVGASILMGTTLAEWIYRDYQRGYNS